MTLRRFPRSLDEAFKGASYAGCIETPGGVIMGLSPIYLKPSLWQRLTRWLRRMVRR